MDQNKVNQILRIAKMHFELKMSQVDIATAENLSKSTVSRILKNAMDLGFVEVRVIEPLHSFSDLEAELISRYPLGKAVIVPDIVQNDEILLRDVCTAWLRICPGTSKMTALWGWPGAGPSPPFCRSSNPLNAAGFQLSNSTAVFPGHLRKWGHGNHQGIRRVLWFQWPPPPCPSHRR